ncbi:TetR/AcrR family transcriptional regulator [Mycolicibacterium septicum DSM 44393]|uniref:TetR/AcrR family transcriptional regulator n=1 Tax=Mycolicibacterium septicum DSM 44393 TaxID=1341646 RepID=A0A7X6RVS2_9MYCO|nr:TetR/AcrR family transcriptional regulator [Mycolicibacterium septicum]NKZ10840.1 TetR/AcrR family transcriptional regulator [Mycolicibacterium septicum DSM 44393]
MSPDDFVPQRMTPQRRSAGRRVTPERLERILDAAVEIAVADGFSAVTMQSVARSTGYVRPVVYDCYGTPENILAAAADRAAAVIAEQVLQISQKVPSQGRGQLAAVLTAVIDAARQQSSAWLLVGVPVDTAPVGVQHRIGAVRGEIRRMLEEALTVSTEDLHTSPDLDIEALAELTHGLVDAFIKRTVDASDPLSLDRIESFVASLAGSVRFVE